MRTVPLEDRNFHLQFLRMIEQIGRMSNHIHVNAHVANVVPPETMQRNCDDLKQMIDCFMTHYKDEYTYTAFTMAH
jgi:hypothetical protein